MKIHEIKNWSYIYRNILERWMKGRVGNHEHIYYKTSVSSVVEDIKSIVYGLTLLTVCDVENNGLSQ